MKKILLLCAFVFAGIITIAQTNTNEAKAAYLLAEESYSKGDYKGAMDYLQQVKTSLGTTNCKILYLEIMVGRELYAKDLDGTGKILALIEAFEKSPDYKDFNEEKSVEISKVKLLVKAEQKNLHEAKERKESENAARAAYEKAFGVEHNRLGPFNISLDELDKQKPGWEVKKWKNYKRTNLYIAPGINFNPETPSEIFPFCAVDKDYDLKNKTSILYTNPAGQIREYRSVLVYTDKKVNTVSPAESLREANYIIESYRKSLGPEHQVVSEGTAFDKAKGNKTIYKWIYGNRGIWLSRLYYPNGNMPVVKLTEIVFYSN